MSNKNLKKILSKTGINKDNIDVILIMILLDLFMIFLVYFLNEYIHVHN
jgi:hypothetical protein